MARRKEPEHLFYASVRVKYWVNVPLKGKTLEEALVEAQSRKLADVIDVVEAGVDVNDYDAELLGISKNDW
jgi:hypothetical protein